MPAGTGQRRQVMSKAKAVEALTDAITEMKELSEGIEKTTRSLEKFQKAYEAAVERKKTSLSHLEAAISREVGE